MSMKMRQIIVAGFAVGGLLLAAPQAMSAPSGKGLHHLTKQKAHERLQKRDAKKVSETSRFWILAKPRAAQR